jgi:hypothetical protein
MSEINKIMLAFAHLGPGKLASKPAEAQQEGEADEEE